MYPLNSQIIQNLNACYIHVTEVRGSVTTLGTVASNSVFPITSTISWALGDSRKRNRVRGQR